MSDAERLADIVGRIAEMNAGGAVDWSLLDSDRRFLLDLLCEARAALAEWEESPWEGHLYPLAEQTEALLADLAPLEER